jgi:hypothetical protein
VTAADTTKAIRRKTKGKAGKTTQSWGKSWCYGTQAHAKRRGYPTVLETTIAIERAQLSSSIILLYPQMKILVDRQSVRGIPASEGEGEGEGGGEGEGSHAQKWKIRSGEMSKISTNGAREVSKVRVRVVLG